MITAKPAFVLFLLLMLSSCASDRYRYVIFTQKDGKTRTENEACHTCKRLDYALTSKGFVYNGCREDLDPKHHRKVMVYGRPVSAIHYRTNAVSRKPEWQDLEKRGGIGVAFDSMLERIVVSQSVSGPGYHEETLKVLRLVENILTQRLGLGGYQISFDREGVFVFDPT